MSANAWELRPEPKFEMARESVRGVIARLRAILANDAPGVCESLAPDEVEMLMLQLKLAAGHLGAAAVALREVEQERRLLVTVMQREELRFEPCGMERRAA